MATSGTLPCLLQQALLCRRQRNGQWPISCQVIVWVRSFIEPDLFDNMVPFDNTIQIYLISLLWKLGLGLDLELHYFRIFFVENNENEHLIFREFYVR